MYCWQIYSDYNRRSHVIDAADNNSSNWMRYVNCARHWKEQNLLAYQYKGQLYYRTIKIIPRFTELMVFYGSEFANALHINLTKYNNAKYYGEVTRKAKPLLTEKISTKSQEPLTEENFDIIDEEIENNDSNQPLSEIRIKNIDLEHCKVLENTVQDHTPIDIEESENSIDKVSIENFQFFKINDENPSKPTITSETKLQNNPSEEKSEKKFKKCDTCQKIVSKKHYSSHKHMHLNPNRFSCSYCPYTTFKKYALSQHISVHTKVYKYSCDICDFKTSYGRNFRSHRAKHENRVTKVKVKPIGISEKICQICGFTTTSRSVIDSHRKKHRNVKFMCDMCTFSTLHSYSLARHRRTVHSAK
ncbi:histone-lysine N-methyltransferase PRDM9-like [Spodoptera frugiperda]|uniref:Histone-lysine N-methyltransferase PRDM9-like n=1 Tax=Spodoptera frugiperda TaxID=7108 RepID=A0A9R0EZ80_SPOFR|nr:histone-lysine N-methyltransferase PRDM9-like [Spodoptera frugiperda]